MYQNCKLVGIVGDTGATNMPYVDSCNQCVCGDITSFESIPEYGDENTFWLERAPQDECVQNPHDLMRPDSDCWRIMYHITEPIYDLRIDLKNIYYDIGPSGLDEYYHDIFWRLSYAWGPAGSDDLDWQTESPDFGIHHPFRLNIPDSGECIGTPLDEPSEGCQ